jgi:hypothetical protein
LFFLAKIFEKEVNNLIVNNLEMIPTLRAILSYLLLELASVNSLQNPRKSRRILIFPFQETMKTLGCQVLQRMDEILGPEHPETAIVLRKLVESFLYDANIYKFGGMVKRRSRKIRLKKIGIYTAEARKAARALWPPRAAIILRHLTAIGTLKDGSNSDFLVLMYLFGLELVGMKMADEAKTMFRAAFDSREKFLGEQHPELSLFVQDLIDVYCQELDRDFDESRRLDINFFIKELAEMCFEHGDYSKTETLIQECPFPSIETTANLNDRKFWPFDSRPGIQSFQGKLAENYTPGPQYYWEDSRLYTRKLNTITVVPTSPNVPFPIPKAPAKI